MVKINRERVEYMELTKEQSIELAESKFYEKLTHREKTMFQLFQSKLCMPFNIFHEAVEKSLGRPVFTHEFAEVERLQKEFLFKNIEDESDELIYPPGTGE